MPVGMVEQNKYPFWSSTSDRLLHFLKFAAWRSHFRPSRDPNISDREAEVEFPLPNAFESISTSYQDWFTQQFKSRYGSRAAASCQ
jgi:hypothetical protein